jgi:hypothetical protein
LGEKGHENSHTHGHSALASRPHHPLKPSHNPTHKTRQVTVLSADPPEAAPSPLWATFCGTVAGGWSGVATAVCPLTGEVEALLPAGPGGVPPPALHLATYTVEERVVTEPDDGEEKEGGGDLPSDHLDRRTVRGRTPASLAPAAAAGEWASADALGSREPGLIIFDGGSYSRGPLSLLGEDDDVYGSDGGGEGVRAELERLVSLPAGEVDEGAGEAALDDEEDDDDDDDDADDPARPASTPDAGWEDSPPTVSVLEACVAWGGEARLRVTLTLGVGLDPDTGELDVTPLRLLTVREAWQCLSGGDVEACAAPASFGDTARRPPSSSGLQAFAGEWKAFDVCGHALAPATAAAADAVGGAATASAAHAVYSTACTRQVWRVGGGGGGGSGGGAGDAGGAYILPGSAPPPPRRQQRGGDDSPPPLLSTPAPGPALVELVMLPPVSRGPDGDAAEGMGGSDGDGGGSGRGFLVSVAWAPRDGTVVGVQREYDAGGALVEARCRSAVRVDAAGGAM